MFHVKICGIIRPRDAQRAIEAGADALGLNFYPNGKRYLSPQQATEVVAAARSAVRPDQANAVKLVGVFVNCPLEQLLHITTSLQLDGIQLHGDEQPSYLARLIQQLPQDDGASTFLLRALHAQPGEANSLGKSQAFVEKIEVWRQAGIDAVLLDAAVPGQYGGTGTVIDWASVAEISNQTELPIVLAGGLTPDNVQQAIRVSQVQSVDVASGVESAPGVKDRTQMRRFVQHAHLAWRPESND